MGVVLQGKDDKEALQKVEIESDFVIEHCNRTIKSFNGKISETFYLFSSSIYATKVPTVMCMKL